VHQKVYVIGHERPCNERLQTRYLLQSHGYDFRYALARVNQLSRREIDPILKASKQPARIYARSLLCHRAILELGMTAVAGSKLLGISQPADNQQQRLELHRIINKTI
jgi:hypothetical protein